MNAHQPTNGHDEEWPDIDKELPWIAESERRIEEETKNLPIGEIGRYFQERAAQRQGERATENE